MAWPDELDEQPSRRWHSRLMRERLDLSISVEATLAEEPLQEDQWADGPGQSSNSISVSHGAAIIPPRLTLQSKALAVVRPGAFIQNATPIPVTQAEPVTKVEHANIFARLAQHITSKLSALRGPVRPVILSSVVESIPSSGPGMRESSLSLPAARIPAQLPGPTTALVIETVAPVSPTEILRDAAQAAKSERRLAGRTTKVHLKTIPKPEGLPSKELERDTDKSKVTAGFDDVIEGRIGTTKDGELSGSGIFKAGQSEVTVGSTHIEESSVVVVTLTGDPGPVVVQYVSLQPGKGFTIHLSAPATATTRFNYVVLMGKLF